MLDSISFFRIIKTGVINTWRNLWLSMAATMVMTVTLVIFAILFLLFSITSYSVRTVQQRVDVSVYMKKGLAEERISSIKNELAQDPAVREVAYVSAQQALADFKERNKSQANILAALNEVDENPLLATLRIKANNLADYPQLTEKLNSDRYKDFIEKINYNDNRAVIEKLDQILKIIISLGLGLIAVFSLIAILVIFNTITLTIYNRREEVEIMRLVGATNWYIRGPFLAEAMLYSSVSAILAGLLFIPIFSRVLPKVALFVDPQVKIFNQNIFNYWFLLLMIFIVASVLSIFSTLMAIRRYLKI